MQIKETNLKGAREYYNIINDILEGILLRMKWPASSISVKTFLGASVDNEVLLSLQNISY